MNDGKIPGPVRDDDEHYFGVCPICLSSDGYVNCGRTHWLYCATHKLAWTFGENVFSSWKWDGPEEWRHAADVLTGCTVIAGHTGAADGHVFTKEEMDEFYRGMVEEAASRAREHAECWRKSAEEWEDTCERLAKELNEAK
jgi:hypothetical protein